MAKSKKKPAQSTETPKLGVGYVPILQPILPKSDKSSGAKYLALIDEIEQDLLEITAADGIAQLPGTESAVQPTEGKKKKSFQSRSCFFGRLPSDTTTDNILNTPNKTVCVDLKKFGISKGSGMTVLTNYFDAYASMRRRERSEAFATEAAKAGNVLEKQVNASPTVPGSLWVQEQKEQVAPSSSSSSSVPAVDEPQKMDVVFS